MASIKITKRAVDGLAAQAKAEGRTLYLWDADMTGFGMLATAKGSVSYFVEYRLGGRGAKNHKLEHRKCLPEPILGLVLEAEMALADKRVWGFELQLIQVGASLRHCRRQSGKHPRFALRRVAGSLWRPAPRHRVARNLEIPRPGSCRPLRAGAGH